MGVPYAEVIGDPIEHSKSPLIHRFWLQKTALESEFRATLVRRGELEAYLAEREADPMWQGCNVTMPHKTDVLDFAAEVEGAAEVIGSANCLVRTEAGLGAFNTDTVGLVEALGPAGLDKKPIVLLGTGGAARAALAVLRTQGLEEIGIISRDEEKAEALAARFGLRLVSPFACDENGATAQLLINATPLGMTGQEPMPESMLKFVDLLPASAMVFDMVYAPEETRLLTRARARGLRAVGGLDMLIGQADPAFSAFFGVPAPREHDQELRELLTS